MWTRKCAHVNKGGKGYCKRKANHRVWCFKFEGEERYEHATWVEVCGNHITDCSEIVSML
jgi:hypothetical protein